MQQIIHGDALVVLRSFKPDTFQAVISDPPYSSGGSSLSAVTASTGTKYLSNPSNHPDFEGDNKSQRSWTNWMTEVLAQARRCSSSGAPICLFIDWRQLPSLSDALQWAGWTWRGTAVWDKINARPQKGRLRQQAEFVVWGSNGKMPLNRNAPVLPGVLSYAMPAHTKRKHQVEKPLDLMRKLVTICEPGGHILDPFCGAGTTVLATKLEGYAATGIEISETYAEIARKRIDESRP